MFFLHFFLVEANHARGLRARAFLPRRRIIQTRRWLCQRIAFQQRRIIFRDAIDA
jgi:hypothetical protein